MVAKCLDILTRDPARSEDRDAVFLGHLMMRAPSPKLVSPSAMEMDFLAAVNMRCNVRPVKRRVASGRGRLGFRRDAGKRRRPAREAMSRQGCPRRP